ncbi:MAG TPA: UMP kinase [Candidatus Moranbacteria bacterium]|nr:UMP kinase [Candidatus Moranbacteria bacterium]
MHKKTVVVSLGGSLIVPNGIDWQFVKEFKEVIAEGIAGGLRFVIVTGGGKTARNYIEAGAQLDNISAEDKDWLGIHATRLNAHFIRTVLREHAHPTINKNPHHLESFKKANEAVLVAAGYRPGNSTDYIATLIAKELGIKKIANLSNIDYVCDKDPRFSPDAKKIEQISWRNFRVMVGDEWDPGANVPFDPVASKLAEKEGMEVAIMNGKKIENFRQYLAGEKFEGTMIN